jgi:hypothetical protein
MSARMEFFHVAKRHCDEWTLSLIASMHTSVQCGSFYVFTGDWNEWRFSHRIYICKVCHSVDYFICLKANGLNRDSISMLTSIIFCLQCEYFYGLRALDEWWHFCLAFTFLVNVTSVTFCCFWRLLVHVKLFVHRLNPQGPSPVCVNSHVLNWSKLLKTFPHYPHAYGFL